VNTAILILAMWAPPELDAVSVEHNAVILEEIRPVARRNSWLIPLMCGAEVLGFVGLYFAFRAVKKAREHDMARIEKKIDAALVILRGETTVAGHDSAKAAKIAVETAVQVSKKLDDLAVKIDGSATIGGASDSGHSLPTVNIEAGTVNVVEKPNPPASTRQFATPPETPCSPES
jgi:hypothetical protein